MLIYPAIDMYEKKAGKIRVATRPVRACNTESGKKEKQSDAHSPRVLANQLLEYAVFKVESEVVQHYVYTKYALNTGGGFRVENTV